MTQSTTCARTLTAVCPSLPARVTSCLNRCTITRVSQHRSVVPIICARQQDTLDYATTLLLSARIPTLVNSSPPQISSTPLCSPIVPSTFLFFFFLNNTPPPEIYPLPLHAAFPI